MALMHLSVRIGKRSSGRSAVQAATYRAGEKHYDERYGEIADYTHKAHVDHTETMLPDNAPAWAKDRGQLWNRVEQSETRKDAQIFREIEASLPRELADDAHMRIVRGFVRDNLTDKGAAVDVAIHRPVASDGLGQDHVHLMTVMRPFDQTTASGFAKKKPREWNDRRLVEYWRADWAKRVNEEYERADLNHRIDHRSYERRGLNLEPTQHRGAAVDRGNHLGAADVMKQNAAIKERNAARRSAIADLRKARAMVKSARAEIETGLSGLIDAASDRKRQDEQTAEEELINDVAGMAAGKKKKRKRMWVR